MKVRDLFEGPHHIELDAPPTAKAKAYPSYEGLQRECDLLGTLEKDNKEFHFWLQHGRAVAYVTTAATDDIGQLRQLIVVDLHFKDTIKLPVSKQLQVTWVYSDQEFRQLWLAGALYIVLARYGNTVVSDSMQYNGGRALWEKLAREADARKYVVRVWDQAVEDWLRAEDGSELKINAAELETNKIWTGSIDPTTLLALSHN